MIAGAYAIDLRPRRATGARRTAPLPLTILALATLGLNRCLETLPVLVIVITLASLALGSLPGLVPRLLALPGLPGLTGLAGQPGATLVSVGVPGGPAMAVTAIGAPARTEPAFTVAGLPPAGVETGAAVGAARAPWQPAGLATALYPARIETWRPLVRELLGEAWQEGRLDGPAARLDDDLVLALIRQESQGDPEAESWVGAIGLMQVMPFTFADVMTGDRSLTCQIDRAAMWDVRSNVRAGLRYLALAMNTHDNLYWALASYNAGIDAVRDWRAAGLYAVPPAGGYWETADYAQRILRDYLSRRPDVAPLIHVPDAMPQSHVPGALRQLKELDDQRGGSRPREWIPNCGR